MDKDSARKFLYVSLGITACIIALSIILIMKKRNDKLANVSATPEVVSPEEDAKLDAQIKEALDSIDFENFDTDKDGVPDWQENIYGLNPTSGQTYGEGTSDKAFVENINASTQQESSVYSELIPSKTEIFAKDLYKISKDVNSEDDIKRIGDDVVESIKTMQVAKVYAKEDIKYASDYKESYRQYISLIVPTFMKSILTYEEYKQMTQSSDAEQEIINLRVYNDRLNAFEKVLILSEPPHAWIDQHVVMLNSISNLRNKVSNILNEGQDPLVVLASISSINDSFYEYYSNSINFLKILQDYLKNV